MHEAARELLDAAYAQDDARPRSSSGMGVSLLGGCARRAYYEITKAPRLNKTSRLASLMGTALHSWVETLGLPGEAETEVSILSVLDDGRDLGGGRLTGHPDRYHDGTVTDWKFPKLSSVEYVKRYGPSRQYRWQVQTYAYMLISNGLADIENCRIVFVPRDGEEEDIHVHEEPYDRRVAEEAIDWLEGIAHESLKGRIPLPEKSGKFCKRYCPFYGELCQGLTLEDVEQQTFDDPWVEAAGRSLLAAQELARGAKDMRAQAVAVLEDCGAVGRYGDIEITWKRNGSGEYPVARKIEGA